MVGAEVLVMVAVREKCEIPSRGGKAKQAKCVLGGVGQWWLMWWHSHSYSYSTRREEGPGIKYE